MSDDALTDAADRADAVVADGTTDIVDVAPVNDVAPNDAANEPLEDAGTCTTSADCPDGYACAYPMTGCSVVGECTWLGAPCDAVDVQIHYCSCEGVTLVGRPFDCPGSAVPWTGFGDCGIEDAGADATDADL